MAGLTLEAAESFREIFLRQFTLAQYLAGLAEAFHSIESVDRAAPQPAISLRGAQPASGPPPSR